MQERDRIILNIIQRAFPIVSSPFSEIGRKAGMDEGEVFERVCALKGEGIIREISGIFESSELGYKSMLVAMKIRADRVEYASSIINLHPGVSHNYERDHGFNIWFTLTLPEKSPMERTVKRLSELCGADEVRLFPNERLFKIGVILDFGGEELDGIKKASRLSHLRPDVRERELIKILQDDLPMEREPFRSLSMKAGIEEREFIEMANGLLKKGIMRRYAATLRHREAGFTANAMVVWDVPEGRIDEVGNIMASFRAVTHCYQRPRYIDWPYNIFTMIHARSGDECEKIIEEISLRTGIKNYAKLYSKREFKKQRVRYFTGEIEEWERRWLSDDAVKGEGGH